MQPLIAERRGQGDAAIDQAAIGQLGRRRAAAGRWRQDQLEALDDVDRAGPAGTTELGRQERGPGGTCPPGPAAETDRMIGRTAAVEEVWWPPPGAGEAARGAAEPGGLPLRAGGPRRLDPRAREVRPVGTRDRIIRPGGRSSEGGGKGAASGRGDPGDQAGLTAGRVAARPAIGHELHGRDRPPAEQLERAQPGEGAPAAAAPGAGDRLEMGEGEADRPPARPAQIPPQRPLERGQPDRAARSGDRDPERVRPGPRIGGPGRGVGVMDARALARRRRGRPGR